MKKKFLYALCFGSAVTALYALLRRYFGSGFAFWMRTLCDGATFAAVLLLFYGGIQALLHRGILGGNKLDRKQNRLREREKMRAYFDRRKQEEAHLSAPFLLAGGIFGALSALCLILYLIAR